MNWTASSKAGKCYRRNRSHRRNRSQRRSLMDPHRDRVQGRSHHQSRGRPPARLVAADDRGREVKTAERALRTVGRSPTSRIFLPRSRASLRAVAKGLARWDCDTHSYYSTKTRSRGQGKSPAIGGALVSQRSCFSAKEVKRPSPRITWSRTLMPMRSPAWRSRSVIARSSADGSGSPDGWLCTRIRLAALERIAGLNTSRGYVAAALMWRRA